MIYSGLCSVTFRQFSVSEVVSVATQAGLKGIEWGGDVHVPHGDLHQAQHASKQCADAGIAICSYGSYCTLDDQMPFKALVDTAAALKAPLIRVWAGSSGSADSDRDYRARIADAARRLAEQAQQQAIAVAFELHQNTLTDTAESTLHLLQQVGHDQVSSYYQQRIDLPDADNLAAAVTLAPHVSHVHVSYYRQGEQCELTRGQALWPELFKILSGDRYALLEFVKSGTKEQLHADAQTLKQWLGEI